MTLADTQAIAFMTRRAPATVRSWAHRGLLPRRGTGSHGRALYAVEDAEAIIDKRHASSATSEAQRFRTP